MDHESRPAGADVEVDQGWGNIFGSGTEFIFKTTSPFVATEYNNESGSILIHPFFQPILCAYTVQEANFHHEERGGISVQETSASAQELYFFWRGSSPTLEKEVQRWGRPAARCGVVVWYVCGNRGFLKRRRLSFSRVDICTLLSVSEKGLSEKQGA